MDRLIDADALKEYIKFMNLKLEDNESIYTICKYIDNAPTIEPTTVYEFKGCDNCELDRPKGKWIVHNDYNESIRYGCNLCGNLTNVNNRFCPNCGAQMER